MHASAARGETAEWVAERERGQSARRTAQIRRLHKRSAPAPWLMLSEECSATPRGPIVCRSPASTREQERRTAAAISGGVRWPSVRRQAARRARCRNRGGDARSTRRATRSSATHQSATTCYPELPITRCPFGQRSLPNRSWTLPVEIGIYALCRWAREWHPGCQARANSGRQTILVERGARNVGWWPKPCAQVRRGVLLSDEIAFVGRGVKQIVKQCVRRRRVHG